MKTLLKIEDLKKQSCLRQEGERHNHSVCTRDIEWGLAAKDLAPQVGCTCTNNLVQGGGSFSSANDHWLLPDHDVI